MSVRPLPSVEQGRIEVTCQNEVTGSKLACTVYAVLGRKLARPAYSHPAAPAIASGRPLIHRGIFTGGALRMRCSTPELLRLAAYSADAAWFSYTMSALRCNLLGWRRT
jgi:hypothetical protein